jgi:signal transduction histidine kinase
MGAWLVSYVVGAYARWSVVGAGGVHWARAGRWRSLLSQTTAMPAWLFPYVIARLVASGFAVVLVSHHGLGGKDVPMLLYGPLSTAALLLFARLRRAPVCWMVDIGAGFALMLLWGDWRSPYYLLWLTALVLPAVSVGLFAGAWLGIGASLSFLGVAIVGGPFPGRLQPVSSETLAIHLVLPFILVVSLAYAAEALRKFELERAERERLAVEAERRRIAWELHDSAKQRLHAAHFLVSSLHGRVAASLDRAVEQAMVELEFAGSDLDTSVAELRSPLEGRPLDVALRERVDELAQTSGVTIRVRGHTPPLPPLVAAHVYRIGAEALTNALRHAQATTIEVSMGATDGKLRLQIADDGRGLPAKFRDGASGLLAMDSRAATVGGRLVVGPRPGGGGTRVLLEVPLDGGGGVG